MRHENPTYSYNQLYPTKAAYVSQVLHFISVAIGPIPSEHEFSSSTLKFFPERIAVAKTYDKSTTKEIKEVKSRKLQEEPSRRELLMQGHWIAFNWWEYRLGKIGPGA